jgi:hypothetical protein
MIEPDYYPLAMAAEKIGCTTNYLICLAAEDKLSLYVRLGAREAMEYPEPFEPEQGDYPEPCYLPDICKVSTHNIQACQNNRSTDIYCLTPLIKTCYEYRLTKSIPLKDVALLVSADDVARLSKKETVKTTFTDNERNTMLRLIIGMAMDAYGYNPNSTRNDATGTNNKSIKAGLERKGINMDDETIRKYLKEAKNIL